MSINNTTNHTALPEDFRIALLALYTLIFIFGTLNVLLMSYMLQSQRDLSFTSVSVINLIAVHSIFLLTVPFRIYYYAFHETWTLSMYFCKIVSLMIHAHMYLAFIFYAFLLIVRNVEQSDQQLKFHRILHATIASAIVWLVIFGSIFPATMANYGIAQNDSTHCFHFGQALQKPAVKTLNYVICILVILGWSMLAFFQVYSLLYVRKTFVKAMSQRVEFRAQLKNIVFLSIMFFCFVPYQGFRVYYVSEYNTKEIIHINEIFLAVTAFSCFDMIVFAGRDICKRINSKGWFCSL